MVCFASEEAASRSELSTGISSEGLHGHFVKKKKKEGDFVGVKNTSFPSPRYQRLPTIYIKSQVCVN